MDYPQLWIANVLAWICIYPLKRAMYVYVCVLGKVLGKEYGNFTYAILIRVWIEPEYLGIVFGNKLYLRMGL